jgi:hypothetical protein
MSERPPNYPAYTECTVMRALQSFHTSNYFTWSLLDGDTCLLWLGFCPTLGPSAY